MPRSFASHLFVLLLSTSLAAMAEGQAPDAQGKKPQGIEPPPRGSPTGATSTLDAPPRAALQIQISDPMLAPVPPPRRKLQGFQEAISLISSRSTEVRVAMQEIERAEGLSRQALSAALPSITARGSIEHDLLRGDQDSPFSAESPREGAGVTVSQPILAPRAWWGIKTAELGAEAARLSATDQQRLSLAAAADAVVTVVTAERVSEINRAGLKNALERLELTRRRIKLGSGTLLDTVRAEQDANLARKTLVSGDESVAKAREALGMALGQSEPIGVPTNISLNGIADEMVHQCSATSAERRADVLSAKTQIEIAERGKTDAKLMLAPTAEVSSTAGYSSQINGYGNHYSWSIQGVLSIPIWDGGYRYGAKRIADAQVEQQKARYEATKRQALLDAAQARRGVLVAEQARLLAEEGRDLARETARLSLVAFEAGTGTSFDLVDSARREREAELDLAVREFELIRARILSLLATAECKV